MQQILSMQAAEEMVLAKDVEMANGRILCGKGTVLSPAIIARILKMEVPHITVEGHPVAVVGEKTLKQELADIEKRFSRVKHVPPLVFIKQKIMKRLVATRKDRK